ncbi:MAG: hypothetical protein AVDCRST_MAG96-3828 [uncultured Segetibacter sp.]|uniref:Uncharacterized protein n=1 Tax=uncultured Segetibacter sp. TaxID=481133 RepID=A0A6J4TZV8_9BACT|nr:MAG: hypothetical protein AVDCRST_MAG96-3828 [uncultured Segetibacter sp.]
MTNNLEFLQDLYSDFISFSPSGITKNKSEVLTRLATKDVRYLCWTDKDVLVEIKEENAILKSRQTSDVELYGLSLKNKPGNITDICKK